MLVVGGAPSRRAMRVHTGARSLGSQAHPAATQPQRSLQRILRSRRWWVRWGGWAGIFVALSAGWLKTTSRIPRMRKESGVLAVLAADRPLQVTPSDAGWRSDTITFVCEMAYELGNMLSYWAYCAALAADMKRVHKVRSHLVVRHLGKDGKRWESSLEDLRSCFPRLSDTDFSLARTRHFAEEYKLRVEEQERGGLKLSAINYGNLARVRKVLAEVAARARHNVTRPPNGTITLPFLAATQMIAFYHNDLFDLYFDEIQEMFEFDADSCCAMKPYPDETVFHLRNYKTEVKPAIAKAQGFKELGPRQAAHDLLGHLRPGDRVAVLSRFSNDEVQQYVAAMRDRGLQVRFIEGQTARQDFCFLLSAKKELVGVSISTYFYWAARLSNASRVVTYSMDVPSMWSRKGKAYFQHNYTHPSLAKRRWVFRLFRPDESPNATVGQSVEFGV